jgi:hypothetical protein
MAERDEKKSYQELQAENLLVQMEHLRQQTEYYRRMNLEARGKDASRMREHASQEEALEIGRQSDLARWKGCTHRTGGQGDDLFANNGDDKFAKIDFTYPDGVRRIHCSRCWATWSPGDTAESHPTGIGYEEAIRWPTRNQPCETVQFRILQRSAAA